MKFDATLPEANNFVNSIRNSGFSNLARERISSQPTMAKGADAIDKLVKSLKPLGFTTKLNAGNVENASAVLEECGTFVDGLVKQIPEAPSELMTDNEIKELKRVYGAVKAFQTAVQAKPVERRGPASPAEIAAAWARQDPDGTRY